MRNWTGSARAPERAGDSAAVEPLLAPCSKWKWEQHGWTLSDGESCGIMNGDDKEQRTALLSILKGHMIRKVEFVSGRDVLEVVSDS